MAINISNYRITPYTQKDLLPKVIFGGTWGIEAEITDHEAGDTYILAVDYERLVYPLNHAVCAYSTDFSISGNVLSMSVNLESSRLAKWVSSLKKPTPIYVQIVRVKGDVYNTILLDDILALPSIIDGDAYQDAQTPAAEELAKKLDKPLETGVEGQVLTLDSALQPIWADTGEAQIGNGTLTITQNGTSKGSFSANQSGNTSINLTGENNVIESVKFNGATAAISNKTAVISASIPTVNNATITITQGGVSKGAFTLNQASAQTIALDAGGSGGGGSWDGTFPQVATSAVTLTAEPAHSYYWEVGAQDATLSASTTSNVDYDVPIDISINGGTVTVSGTTRIGLLVDGCLNRCIITRRYDDAILYVYAYEVLS